MPGTCGKNTGIIITLFMPDVGQAICCEYPIACMAVESMVHGAFCSPAAGDITIGTSIGGIIGAVGMDCCARTICNGTGKTRLVSAFD
jgi:hypothetical protein